MSKEDYVRMSLWAFIATCLKCVFCLFSFLFSNSVALMVVHWLLNRETHWDDVGGNTEEGGMLGKPTSTHPNEELS